MKHRVLSVALATLIGLGSISFTATVAFAKKNDRPDSFICADHDNTRVGKREKCPGSTVAQDQKQGKHKN